VIGTDRYRTGRLLGRGACGEVWEAVDQTTGERVALKTLRGERALDLYLLKREFRLLTHLRHPNLVGLRELLQEGEGWWLAMDLVEGVDLRRWVWGASRGKRSKDSGGSETWLAGATPDPATLRAEAEAPVLNTRSIERMRSALRGLAQGLHALHDAGRLHRDVKPEHVLCRDGHAILLDFGLVTDSGEENPGIGGTPAYMAPEQASGERITPASDWYAVGAVMYELLAGRPPFIGTLSRLLTDKRYEDPKPVRDFAPDVPNDLADLTDALVQRDPLARPSGHEVLVALGLDVAPRVVDTSAFVGRGAPLAHLRAAWADVTVGVPRSVWIRGRSGIGKSRLLARFLDEIRTQSDAFVLTARCYERESVPFKAVDPLVDALSEYLDEIHDLERLLPDGVRDLATLFPTLGRISAIANAEAGPATDPKGTRRRAFAALRELLIRIAKRQPMVVFVDDLQWGDLDSARLLGAILRGPEPPPILCILAWREEDPAAVPLVEVIEDSLPKDPERIDLMPLEPHESQELIASILGVVDARAAAITKEAEGSPFFVAELARHAQRSSVPVSLEGLMTDRLDRLKPQMRILLEVIAIATRPLPVAVALQAARSIREDIGERQLVWLEQDGLVTVRGAGVHCTHDRIREAATGALQHQTARQRHLAVAERLAERDAEPGLLAHHFNGGGDRVRALEAALMAGDSAEAHYAFAQAAEAWRLCLEVAPADHPDRSTWLVSMAMALVAAGKVEGVDAMLAAVAAAEPDEAARLHREAVLHMVRVGELDRAYAELPAALKTLGAGWPASSISAVAELGWQAIRGYFPIFNKQLSDADRARLDFYSELGSSLSPFDWIRGTILSGRAAIVAERGSDPYWFVYAKAIQGANLSASDRYKLADRYLGEADSACESAPDSLPVLALARSADHAYHCSWSKCYSWTRRGREAIDAGMRFRFTSHTLRLFEMGSLAQMARYSEYEEVRAEAIEEARAAGYLTTEALFRAAFGIQPGLIHDDPDEARRNLDRAEACLSNQPTFAWLSYHLERAQIDCYVNRPEEGLARMVGIRRRALRSGLLFVGMFRSWWNGLLVICAARLPEQRQQAHSMRLWVFNGGGASDYYWGGFKSGARAAMAGDYDRAIDIYTTTAERMGETGMQMHQLAATRAAAFYREDHAIVAVCEAGMAELGIANPRAFSRHVIPIVVERDP